MVDVPKPPVTIVQTGPHSYAVGGPVPAFARQIAEVSAADERREATRTQIAELVNKLHALERDLGWTTYLDEVIALRVDQVRQKLEPQSDAVSERNLAVRLVRHAARELRGKTEGVTAETIADAIIAKSQDAGVTLIPFAAKLPKARAQLVTAIASSGKRQAASEATLLAFLAKIGLKTKSASTLRMGRKRRKRHIPR